MPEKKKLKFTVIDAIIVIVILAVAAFVASRFFGKDGASDAVSATYEISFYFEEVPEYAAVAINEGDTVTDEGTNTPLGEVVSVEVGDSASYASDSAGNICKSSKDGYKSVKLTSRVQASEFEHGVKVSDVRYVIGHSLTLYAGKAKIYGKVAAIEKK